MSGITFVPVYDRRNAPLSPILAYPDGPAHARLLVLVAIGAGVVALSFMMEDLFLPWRVRMYQFTSGWATALAQSIAVAVACALAVRGGWLSVAQGLLAATIAAYAYSLGGLWIIDPARSLQTAHVVSRGVQLGLVSAVALTLGVAARLVLRQRLALAGERLDERACSFNMTELLFLTAACAAGLGVAKLFAYDFHRDDQVFEIAVVLLRALPATLPWLWLLTQPRPTLRGLAGALAIGGSVALIKVIVEPIVTGHDAEEVRQRVALSSLAYTITASANGLLLRWMGFRWRRG